MSERETSSVTSTQVREALTRAQRLGLDIPKDALVANKAGANIDTFVSDRLGEIDAILDPLGKVGNMIKRTVVEETVVNLTHNFLLNADALARK